MSPEEKSIQYSDLNANKRLLEIQAEIIAIEKRRIYDNVSEEERNEMKEKIKFLVSEEKMILESRYSKQKDIKNAEGNMSENQNRSDISEILKSEIAEDRKIEGELKEIIQATKDRLWYEKWWGKLIIIMTGAVLVGLLGNGTVNISELVG